MASGQNFGAVWLILLPLFQKILAIYAPGMCVCMCACVCASLLRVISFYLFHQISTRTDLLGEDGLSDANQKGVDSYVNFWTGRDVLYVYFLNPDILEQEKWECEYGVLNIDNILSWAEAWNPK